MVGKKLLDGFETITVEKGEGTLVYDAKTYTGTFTSEKGVEFSMKFKEGVSSMAALSFCYNIMHWTFHEKVYSD